MQNILIAYIPVLHAGYHQFFEKYADLDAELWILGGSFADEFKEIKKDIRSLDPKFLQSAVESWSFFKNVRIIERGDFPELQKDSNLIMPNDDVMHQVAKKYFPKKIITYEPVFLRWDKHTSLQEKPVAADATMAFTDFDRKIMKQAFQEASHSTDWWRHVGGVVVKDGEVILLGYNRHLPTENEPYFHNDVRSLFSQGLYFEFVSSIHTEAIMIAEAAKRGISLDGASMYVTTFPCPVCAKQVAHSGVKKLYYSGEYGMLDGENVMKTAGVELVHVQLDEQDMEEVRRWEEERSIVKRYE